MADRRWITSGARRLSTQHLKGVEEFMQHVCTVFAKDVAILCPCCECLNHYQLPQGTVEDHLLLRGMASTYDRWIHHGETLDADPSHAEPDAGAHDDNDDTMDFVENVLQENAGLEEEDG
jgi:hypothetical protein